MELLEIRFGYFCRTTFKRIKGDYPIVLRITFRGQRRDLFTGIYCKKEDWDQGLGRMASLGKESISINKNLEHMLRKANHVFDQFRFSEEAFSIDELVAKIKGKEEKPQTLMEFLQTSVTKMKKRVGIEITKPTYYKYKKTYDYVLEYLQAGYKMKNYLLVRIDVSFLDGYFRFLRQERNISHNTSLKYMSFFKVMLGPVIRVGVIKDDPFRQLKLKAKPVTREFLTQEEIMKIQNLELDNPELERKKDIFLFACYTGLAYTDLKQLSPNHFVKDADETYYILKPRQKTGQESIIPLLPAAEQILIKYSTSKDLLDFNWYISTNQKMNLGLKYIGKKAGIRKILHMHLARHTFATTVTLGNGVPIETVSKMLGHANLRQTQHYAKVVASKIKFDMIKVKEVYK